MEDLFGSRKRKPVDGNYKKNNGQSEKPDETPKEEWPTLGSERKKRQQSKDPTGSAFGVYE